MLIIPYDICILDHSHGMPGIVGVLHMHVMDSLYV